MKPDDVLKALPEDALLLEPRSYFDRALVGVTDTPGDDWPRKERRKVAVYSTSKCIAAIMLWLRCDYEDAVEWYSYNTSGAWLGEGTPTFRLEEV